MSGGRRGAPSPCWKPAAHPKKGQPASLWDGLTARSGRVMPDRQRRPAVCPCQETLELGDQEW